MVIRLSSARHIDALLEDLTAGSAVAREAAVARLILVGGRAVDRLTKLAALTETPTAARLGAFRALEGIGDVRGLDSHSRRRPTQTTASPQRPSMWRGGISPAGKGSPRSTG